MNAELYITYALTDNMGELKITETLWLSDAKAAADKAQTQHPTARVIVVKWNSADNRDKIVYEATKEAVKTITAVYTQRGKRQKLDGFVADYGDYRLPSIYDTKAQAEKALDEYVYEGLSSNACAGFGCVDGCGDCADDLDFSNDEPTINAQLAAKGMRAATGERGAFVNVREHGRVTQVWACPISQERPAPVKQFFSYAETKGD